jgi:hypothetical protein
MKFVDEEILYILDCVDDVRDRICFLKAIGWDVSHAVGNLSGDVLDRFEEQFQDLPRLMSFGIAPYLQVEVTIGGPDRRYHFVRLFTPNGGLFAQVRHNFTYISKSLDLSTWIST